MGSYCYLALRVRSDREMLVVLGLIALPNPGGGLDQPYFAFNGYVRPQVGSWRWIVLDLTKLELEVEGPGAYDKAGRPPRPMHLTMLKFYAHKKDEKASFAVDEIMFLRELPKELKPYLLGP